MEFFLFWGFHLLICHRCCGFCTICTVNRPSKSSAFSAIQDHDVCIFSFYLTFVHSPQYRTYRNSVLFSFNLFSWSHFNCQFMSSCFFNVFKLAQYPRSYSFFLQFRKILLRKLFFASITPSSLSTIKASLFSWTLYLQIHLTEVLIWVPLLNFPLQ